jgi:hypothetical protein
VLEEALMDFAQVFGLQVAPEAPAKHAHKVTKEKS